WGSIFSFEGGGVLRKWPKRIPYPVTVSFGAPMPASSTAHEMRQAILELGSNAAERRKRPGDVLPLRFIRSARKNWRKFAMADSSGRELTYGETLTGSLLIAEWIRKHRRDEQMIGVLLPASVGGALVNAGISMAGKAPVNLNFTAGRDAMEVAIERCQIGTVLTSKAFLTKAKIDAINGAEFVENILAEASRLDKAIAFVRARLMPSGLLLRRYATSKATPDGLATVIFSSGSTGIP